MGARAWLARWGKTFLGHLVFGLGFGRVLLRGRAVVVALHRVTNGTAHDAMTLPSAVFDRWCRYFRKHFDVVDPQDLVSRLERGDRLGGELAITFDDGYRDFRTRAVPVLAAHGLAAAVFMVSDYVGEDVIPWWDEAVGECHPFLDWAELRDVADRGFTVGSHGKTHAAMDTLSPDEARLELTQSKASLESGLGRPVTLYAYPYGHPRHMPDAYRDLARQAGYRACFGYGGLVDSSSNPFFLPRVCVNDWFSCPAQFGGHLVVLRLRQLFGQNRDPA